MIAVVMLIPVKSNENVRFTAAHHAAFEANALSIVGGFTRLPKAATGGWQFEGSNYHDQTIVYVFGIASLISEGWKIRELAEFAKSHYQQLAISVSYLGLTENL